MIKQSKYVPRQMNGPIINSLFMGMEEELTHSETIIDYLENLSIDKAQETELESIGCLVGFPRPLVPEGFNEENVMLLGTIPLEKDESIGLSQIDSEIGGRLSTIEKSNTGFMDLGTYRKLLKKAAEIKRYGITLKSVDDIAQIVSTDYTIEWDEYGDILINYSKSIGYKNVWLLTQLFLRICTEPQVKIQSGA
jgi:hypothetical protein